MENIPSDPVGTARLLIARHGMARIPQEGAWFALNHVSDDRLAEAALPARYAGSGSRALGNAILALVTPEDFSAMHRLRSDETWHFYGGDPLELLLLHADGGSEVVSMGPDTLGGQRAQVTVRAGTWMGARPAGGGEEPYSFFGCTLAPGFDPADYEPGYRDELTAGWPERAALIAALTRDEYLTRPAAMAPGREEPAAIARGDGNASASVASPACAEPGRVVRADEPRVIEAGAGVILREIVGRGAADRTEALSLTRFRLEAGAGTGASRYHGGDERFYILSGRGVAEIDGRRERVGAGDVVVIRRGESHALTADADGPLEFLAVIVPGFDPAHYAPETA